MHYSPKDMAHARRPGRESPLVLLALLALALMLLTAACGGSADGADDGVADLDDGTATTASGSDDEEADEVDYQQAMLDHAACMRAEGLDFPDPEFDEDGKLLPLVREHRSESEQDESFSIGPGDEEAVEEAEEKCREHLAGVVMEDIPRNDDLDDAMLEYTECMREHGVDMPDPVAAGGEDGPSTSSVDEGDEEMQAALEACDPILREAIDGEQESQP